MTNKDPDDKVERKTERPVTAPSDSAITKGSDSDVVLKEQQQVSKNRDKMPSGIQPALHESFEIIDHENSRSIERIDALGTPESKQFAELRREIRRKMPPGEKRDNVETETKKAIEDVLEAGQRAHRPSDLDGGTHEALGLKWTLKNPLAPSIPEQKITVGKDDTLDKIASFMLGRSASPEDIKSYCREIAKQNNIKDLEAELKPGERLKLPPSTAGSDSSVAKTTSSIDSSKLSDRLPADPAESNFEQQRISLLKLAREKGLDLTDNMRQIESMHSPQESSETFKNVNRILLDTSDAPLTLKQKEAIAEQIINQAAHPTRIDQGNHKTCNVTTIESRTYTRTPSIAAKLVADVVLDGKFVSPHGVTVELSAYTFDQESSSNTPSSRTHASEIFQRTAVNLHYELASRYTGHNIRYIQLNSPGRDDTGERLIDYTRNPPTKKRAPELVDRVLCEISNLITGKSEKGLVICNERNTCGTVDSQITQIKSEQDLAEAIKRLKAENKLPVVLRVDCKSEPFFTDSGGGIEGGSEGAHVVTVRDIVGSPPRVMIDNQWGEKDDHLTDGVPLHDLYIATLRPKDAAAELRKDVMHNRSHGHIDSYKEFDLIRLEYTAKIIPNQAGLEKAFQSQLTKQSALWKEQEKHGNLNKDDKTKALSVVDTLIEDGLDTFTQRAKARAFQNSLGIVSKDEFEMFLAAYGRIMSDQPKTKSWSKDNLEFREFLKKLPNGQGAKIMKDAHMK